VALTEVLISNQAKPTDMSSSPLINILEKDVFVLFPFEYNEAPADIQERIDGAIRLWERRVEDAGGNCVVKRYASKSVEEHRAQFLREATNPSLLVHGSTGLVHGSASLDVRQREQSCLG